MNEIAGLNLEGELVRLLYAMLRTGAAFIVAPIFAAVSVPIQVRVALAAAIGVLVMGVYDIQPPPEPFSVAGLMVAVQETLVGFTLGFVLQIAFAAPVLAGEYIASASGLGFAAMVDPQGGTQSPVIGQFLMLLMTLTFLSLDGHLILLEVIARSYELLPMGGSWLSADKAFEVARFGGFVFSAGLAIALPVGFALFAVNLLIGFLTRTAPQLNVFAVGLPITVMTGFVVMAIAFPAMSALMVEAAETAIQKLDEIMVP